jgi:hypothetical protein
MKYAAAASAVIPLELEFMIIIRSHSHCAWYSIKPCIYGHCFIAGNAWILTRSRHPTLEIMEKAYSVVDKHGISRAYFIRTDQKNCPKMLY